MQSTAIMEENFRKRETPTLHNNNTWPLLGIFSNVVQPVWAFLLF